MAESVKWGSTEQLLQSFYLEVAVSKSGNIGCKKLTKNTNSS